MGCVSNRVSFSRTRKAHMVWESAPLLFQQELCRRQLDPQQLVARMRHHFWTTHTSASFAVFHLVRFFENLQLVSMTFVNLLLVRMTFAPIVSLQLARTGFENLQLVSMNSVSLQLVRLNSSTFVNLQLVYIDSTAHFHCST